MVLYQYTYLLYKNMAGHLSVASGIAYLYSSCLWGDHYSLEDASVYLYMNNKNNTHLTGLLFIQPENVNPSLISGSLEAIVISLQIM